MSKTQELINEISSSITQSYASKEDEVRVMKEMLNDKEYRVGEYNKSGKIGEICPSENARAIISNSLSTLTGMTKDESDRLADKYEFDKKDAQNFVGISKEYVYTYLRTNRKLPLGSREDINCKLYLVDKKQSVGKFPQKVGVDANGDPIWKIKETPIKPHKTIRVQSKTL